MDGERVLKWQRRADTGDSPLFACLGCESARSQTLVTHAGFSNLQLSVGLGRSLRSALQRFIQAGQTALHIIGMFNDKQSAARQIFELIYEAVGAATPPACSSFLRAEHRKVCERHLEDASVQLCRSAALGPKGLLSAAL